MMMLPSKISPTKSPDCHMKVKSAASESKSSLRTLTDSFLLQEIALREEESRKERQVRLGRLTARERLNLLLDESNHFFELGLWAAYKMYEEWGNIPAAGVITGIGKISGRECMVIANDAT